MADPRFFRNAGPFTLAVVAARVGAATPEGGERVIGDLATLTGAGPAHLAFYGGGGGETREAFRQSRAGFCLVPQKGERDAPADMVLIPCASVQHGWSAAASLFYPDTPLGIVAQTELVSGSARIAADVILGAGAAVGPDAEIGAGTRIGAGATIGAGVAIGRNCEIGAGARISHAYIGDEVIILPGAAIGQPGFGVAPSAAGHVKIPQLGRVIIQDRVEIGANTTIDRGALGDTVIGESTKIDNLVMIAHNVQIGRNCIIVSQVGIAGSSVIEDFVVLGGQVGIADHVHIKASARLAARSGAMTGQVLEGGRDYGGVPPKPVRQWLREIHAVGRLARFRKQDTDE